MSGVSMAGLPCFSRWEITALVACFVRIWVIQCCWCAGEGVIDHGLCPMMDVEIEKWPVLLGSVACRVVSRLLIMVAAIAYSYCYALSCKSELL